MFSLILKTLLSAGVIGAGATIFTNLVTNDTNRKQQFLTTITQNRYEWREKVRKEAAEFCSIAYDISSKLSGNATDNLSGDTLDELLKDRRMLQKLETSLRLRMDNPDISYSREIVEHTKKIADMLNNNSDKKEELLPILEELKCYVQVYLQHSWEMAKKEALNGESISSKEQKKIKDKISKQK